MFGRQRKIQHPIFGEMTHASGDWMTADSVPSKAGPAIIYVEGSPDGPHASAVDLAVNTIQRATEIVSLAKVFVTANESAMEFVGGGGRLQFDGLSFRANGDFSVNFGVVDWPDAMVDVQFRDGQPYDVWLAD